MLGLWDKSDRAKARGLDLSALGPDLYSLHKSNGDAVHVGANAGRVFGVDCEAIAGGGFVARIHVSDRVAVVKAIDDTVSGDAPQKVQFRLVGTDADGRREVRWFEMRCMPAPEIGLDECGRPLVLAITRDISERRELEEELRRQREKSESANTAKSRFLANMSHELRTPLNAILGFSELLQSDAMTAMPPERHQEYVGLIHSSAGHLLSVVNDILDMSKIESGKYEIVTEPFDIAQAIRASCAILVGQAEQKNIQLVVGDMEELPEVTADQRALKQIMINLVSNAIKFTDPRGRITVGAKRRGRQVRITVADNGIGISAEHLPALGQPFYQADSRYDRKYEGSGLGLSVVFGLVELHHGSIRFSSEKGIGTTVTVDLPILPPDTKPVPASEAIEVVQLNQRGRRKRTDFEASRRTA